MNKLHLGNVRTRGREPQLKCGKPPLMRPSPRQSHSGFVSLPAAVAPTITNQATRAA
jgi:hypothetical protein